METTNAEKTPPRLIIRRASMTQKGVINLPKDVRRALRVETGGQVVFFLNEKKKKATLVSAEDAFKLPE